MKISKLFLSILGAGCFGAANAATPIVANGAFLQGNVGFTSEYVYYPNTSGSGICQTTLTEGCFVVGTNPNQYNPAWLSFTSRNGAGDPFFIANGSPDSSFVWEETLTVTPNVNYRFATWMTANYNDPSPADLKIEFAPLVAGKTCADVISLVKVGSMQADALHPGTWVEKKTGIRSPTDTICVRITNAQNAMNGNDFSLDDISLEVDPFAPFARPVVVSVPKPILATAGTNGAEPIEIHVLDYVTAGTVPVDPTSLDLDLAKDGPQASFFEAGVGEFRVIPDDGSYAIAFYPEPGFTSGLATVTYQVSSVPPVGGSLTGSPSNVAVAEVYVCEINCSHEHEDDDKDGKDVKKSDDSSTVAPVVTKVPESSGSNEVKSSPSNDDKKQEQTVSNPVQAAPLIQARAMTKKEQRLLNKKLKKNLRKHG